MVSTNNIRLASDLTFDSIVDGPGLRMVVWTQGCTHNCKGCHNPQTHAIEDGKLVAIEDIIAKIEGSQLQSGLTLSGGEPFLQAQALLPIVEAAKKKGLNIWAFSGFTFEQLQQNPIQNTLLEKLDVLVDGKFIEAKKDYRLHFKGSSNQRIIDVQKSLQEKTIVLHEIEKQNEI